MVDQKLPQTIDKGDDAVSRREILTYAGVGVAGAGMIGAGSMLMSGRASAWIDVETEDLEVSTPDGKVEEIKFNLGGDASYSNIDPEVKGFVFTTSVDGEEIDKHSVHKSQMGSESTGFNIGPQSGSFPYHSGIDRTSPKISLFENSSKDASQYEVTVDGETETFTFDVEVEFGIYTEDGSPDDPVVTTTGSNTIDLTIVNEEDGNSGGGSGGGGGGGGSGGGGSNPDPEASISSVQVALTVELPNGDTVS